MEKRVPRPIDRAFNRLYGTDPQTRGEVYVFKGWVDEARHALPYRYVVALGLSLVLVGLLMILMGSKS